MIGTPSETSQVAYECRRSWNLSPRGRPARCSDGFQIPARNVFADYYQIHLFDDGSVTDLGDAWTEEAVLDHLAVDTNAMAVGTSVNVNVAVTVEVLDAAPEDDSAEFDHVAEGSLQVSSGRLVIMGCTDYEPEAARFGIAAGPVRVRAARSNLAEAERLGIDSDDDPATTERLRLQIWPAPHADPVVIKRWQPLQA